MKSFGYIILIAIASVGTLRAQMSTNTNAVDEILALVTTNAPAVKPPPPRAPTRIESDRVDFDLTAREATYHGHVYVDDPAMKLRCEWLVANLLQTAGRVTNIVAETNVVIDATDDKGQTMHATCDKAIYAYAVQNGVTNETVTLTGNAKVENAKGWLTGEPIVWDRANGSLTAANEHMVFWQNLNGETAGTNSPVAQTNPAPATHLVATETNSPPAMTNQPAAAK
jgi:lipopolysaccharide transport protein LptA